MMKDIGIGMFVVAIFWGGILIGKYGHTTEYLQPITVYAPHNTEDMTLILWAGVEHHCYLTKPTP